MSRTTLQRACLLLAFLAALLASGCSSASSAGTTPQSASSVRTKPTHKAHHHAKGHPRKRHRHHARKRHRRARRRVKHTRARLAVARAAGVPRWDVPNPALTPGAVLTTSVARICTAGYSASVRDVPQSEKDEVYARYHVAYVPYAHEVDHLVSLELGGSNSIRNLWPEPYAGRWGARTKDQIENTLHDLVCSGQLKLRYAQHLEARDWVAAYKRYIGTPTTSTATSTSSSPASTSGQASSGGYYASSYPTASTIYCADDSAWKELSKTYLQHYATLTAARAANPGYHLHQPC